MTQYKILGEFPSGAPGSPRYFPGSIWDLPDDETTQQMLTDGVIEAITEPAERRAKASPEEPLEEEPEHRRKNQPRHR